MNDFLDEFRKQAKASLSTVASASKRQLEKRQAQKDLQRLYWKLGKEVVTLVEAGEIQHPALEKRRKRILEQVERVKSASR
ncbi:MAG: hypothetical protein VXW32_09325 [Myxococcota bacterium]|jgi:hypothetical protein|nr:hypothetical protein [Myxococcota bacterium]